MKKATILKDAQMYFQPKVVEDMSLLEQNEKHYKVADIIDQIIEEETKSLPNPLKVAELGGGSHPDRYHRLFSRLLTDPKGSIDWVDVAPLMLEQAKKYLKSEGLEERNKVITFLEDDILSYLTTIEDNHLDLAIMKYTFDHIDDIDLLFQLLSKKMKPHSRMIANITSVSPQLKSSSTNARFLYNGQEFLLNETREMKDGDTFTIRFYKVSGNPDAGYLEGAESTKYFHSEKKIRELAAKYGFETYLGDWKNVDGIKKSDSEMMALDVLILRK